MFHKTPTPRVLRQLNEAHYRRAIAVQWAVIVSLSIALLTSIAVNYQQGSNIYILKPNGETAIATSATREDFIAEALPTTAESFIKLSYEWDLHNPDNKNAPCLAELKNIGAVVPCKIHDVSFLLSPRIRSKFLRIIAGVTTKAGLYDENGIFSFVQIFFTSTPHQTSSNTYYIDLIASRVDLKISITTSGLIHREQVNDEILNNRIFFQVISPDRLIDRDLKSTEIALRRQIHSLLSAGLIITDIQPIDVPIDFRKPLSQE